MQKSVRGIRMHELDLRVRSLAFFYFAPRCRAHLGLLSAKLSSVKGTWGGVARDAVGLDISLED